MALKDFYGFDKKMDKNCDKNIYLEKINKT